jgi:hypothetical protein|uniref:Uncharacterized protein n=1 Tax=Podoviridae sp. ctKzN3 TaxID=2826553 RepID=A0A8S5NGW2_9CAUD|nr:MAG TPA: hypothetical protein [Podoviridae sp. ctKzN3]
MKLKEYLANAQLFPLMGVSQLNDIGEVLDKMLKAQHGLKTCGAIITEFVEPDGTVSLENQQFIANAVYQNYKAKWDSLIKFASEEVNPLVEKTVKTKTNYGKIVDEKLGGTDVVNQTDKIAGFDSADFVDKDSQEHSTTHGRTSNTTNTGSDEKIVESRLTQAEVLVDYTLNFWDKYGITRTVIADALSFLTLPLYELD